MLGWTWFPELRLNYTIHLFETTRREDLILTAFEDAQFKVFPVSSSKSLLFIGQITSDAQDKAWRPRSWGLL